ncbi:MAG: hypothetical protein QOH60_2718 [Mycobacterium sp.]|nr:hypothetical protein [Mycobacterium sp.]
MAAIAMAIAAVGVALAAWSLLRPTSNTAGPPATDKQIADAKARACAASDTVRAAVSLQTHADLGGDPATKLAVAANARLSMAAGGSYLLGRLDAATPVPLSTEIRLFADDLQDISIHTLAGISNDEPAQAARLRDGQAAAERIAALCR